ncbi:MAG TPA: hypothetical protein VFZ61_15500 [Polyangiales bacterium]
MTVPISSRHEPATWPRARHVVSPGWALLLQLLTSCGEQEPGPSDTAGLPEAGVTAQDAATIVDAMSCGAVRVDGGAVPPSFETIKLVFGGGGGIMPCSAAPCHGVNGAAPPDHPLELPPNDDEKLFATLRSYVSKACGDIKLVEPCNPSRSALVSILKGACGTTPRMPYGCTSEAGDCIPDEYIAAVEQWIANGATRP